MSLLSPLVSSTKSFSIDNEQDHGSFLRLNIRLLRMTTPSLEDLILQSYQGDPVATQRLQDWSSPDPQLLLTLVAHSPHEPVQFYALTLLGRLKVPILPLLDSHWQPSSVPLRNKVASILAQQVSSDSLLALVRSPPLFCKTVEILLEEESVQTREKLKAVVATNDGVTLLEQLLIQLGDIVAANNNEEESVLALQAIAACFRWTLLENDRVLELLLLSLQPRQTSMVQAAAWKAWIEWTCEDVLHTKANVVQTVLDRVLDYNLLPPQREESSFDIEVVILTATWINTVGLLSIAQFPNLRELFFRSFEYDDIDVSAAVLPLAAAWNDAYPSDRPRLLLSLYRQLQYPPDFGYDWEDDDDAEEEVYRTELCKLYVAMVRADPVTCLHFVSEAAAQFLTSDVANCPSSPIETTLRLLYQYCEGIRPPPGLKQVMKNEAFCSLLIALHQSNVSCHPHREVLCWYYDVAVRYHPVLAKDTALLQRVLEALTSTRGLQHPHAKVRSRCCYLLLKLTKAVTALLRPMVEQAAAGILRFLSDPSLELRAEDQLYLFECVGLLLGKTGLEDAVQANYLGQVLEPHLQSMQTMLASPNLQTDAEHYGDLLSGSIATLAYLSKGFAKPSDEVLLLLTRTLDASLAVLKALPQHDDVRGKVMVHLQRMIQCVGARVGPYIPELLSFLIRHAIADDVLFVAQVFNQLCIKFKKGAVPMIDGSLLPFLMRCNEVMPTNSDGDLPPHLQTEQLAVQKLVYTVLQHIVSYDATPVLFSPSNVGYLETMLQTMTDGAVRVEDPVVKKTCVRFFRELVASDISNTDHRQGVLEFVFAKFVPPMMAMIAKLDPKDALQSRVFYELAVLLVAMKDASPDRFLRAISSFGPAGNMATVKEMEAWLVERSSC